MSRPTPRPMLHAYHLHTPDSDLCAYHHFVGDARYTVDDILGVAAAVMGHNDEDAWFWVVALTDGRYMLTMAHCDYTGWDCQASGGSTEAASAEDACALAPELDYGREIQRNLRMQLHGEQPYGIESYDR